MSRTQLPSMVPMSMLKHSPEKPAAVAPPGSDDDGGEELVGPLLLEVKRIARRYDQKQGKYRDEEDIEETNKRKGGLDARYAFTIVRQFDEHGRLSTFISVRSLFFIEVAKAVLAPCRDLTWITTPMSFPSQQLVSFLPRFKDYLASLESKYADAMPPKDEAATIDHLRFFVRFMENEHQSTLHNISALLADDKITFDLLWAILIPGIIVVTNCHLTGEPRAVRLISAAHVEAREFEPEHWLLESEYVDFTQNVAGITQISLKIFKYDGAMSVTDLNAFPMEPFLSKTARVELEARLIARGRRYTELSVASCHKRYSGIAYKPKNERKIGIKSRVVLDKALYEQYAMENEWKGLRERERERRRLSSRKFWNKSGDQRGDPTDEEFMLMPAVLHGFSLGDRKWLLFNVMLVEDIVWNPEAFDHLDISRDKKDIVRNLTLSHTRNAGVFDDFIEGKGVGLIFNLHGTPGVGKTLTAEATSEVARSPLYVVGAGDLGITAEALDSALARIFVLASAWKAVVLIDEADVFLEKRDIHDLARNAMVAVFLRQLEYFPGILILTTNRVNVIDDAIKSRIHVSLHYNELGAAARRRLWQDFLLKAGMSIPVDEAVLDDLSQRPFNGREIKNIVKVASTFASYNGRAVEMSDVVRVINADEDGEV